MRQPRPGLPCWSVPTKSSARPWGPAICSKHQRRGTAVPDLGNQEAGKQLSEPPLSVSWKLLMLGQEDPQNQMVSGDCISSQNFHTQHGNKLFMA